MSATSEGAGAPARQHRRGRRHHFAVQGSDGDAVDAHAGGRDLQGETLAEGEKTAGGRGHIGLARQTGQREPRRADGHRSVPRVDHAGHHGAADRGRAAEVERQERIPLLRRHLPIRRRLVPRVRGDEHRDRPELGGGTRGGRRHLSAVGEVDRQGQVARAGVGVEARDAEPLRLQSLDHCASHDARGARHQGRPRTCVWRNHPATSDSDEPPGLPRMLGVYRKKVYPVPAYRTEVRGHTSAVRRVVICTCAWDSPGAICGIERVSWTSRRSSTGSTDYRRQSSPRRATKPPPRSARPGSATRPTGRRRCAGRA